MDMKRYMVHDLTHWVANGLDMYAKPNYTLKYITGRFESKETQTRDAEGNRIDSSNVVYLMIRPAIGDYIYHGLSDHPVPIKESYEIKFVSSFPSLDGTQTIYQAIL